MTLDSFDTFWCFCFTEMGRWRRVELFVEQGDGRCVDGFWGVRFEGSYMLVEYFLAVSLLWKDWFEEIR